MLVEAEILFDEFFEGLLYYFNKKVFIYRHFYNYKSLLTQKNSYIKNETEIDEYLKNQFKTFIKMNQNNSKNFTNLDMMQWPYSEKDKMWNI